MKDREYRGDNPKLNPIQVNSGFGPASQLEPAIQEPLQLEPGDKILCNVCGTQITEDIVYCTACKTPHHRKCWEYNGKCTTYACGCESYNADIPENPYWGEEPD